VTVIQNILLKKADPNNSQRGENGLRPIQTASSLPVMQPKILESERENRVDGRKGDVEENNEPKVG